MGSPLWVVWLNCIKVCGKIILRGDFMKHFLIVVDIQNDFVNVPLLFQVTRLHLV